MSTIRYEIEGTADALRPRLRYITHSRYNNEWLSAVHSHSIAEMLYILDGDGCIIISGSRRAIETGDFVMIPPHFQHAEVSSSKNPLEYLCLGVSDIMVTSSTDDFDPIMNLGNSKQAVRNLVKSIYREMQRRQVGYEMMAKSLFYNLLVILMRSRIIDIGHDEEIVMRSNVAEVKNYIDEHYAESFTLDNLASIATLSKYHLIREFRNELGTSPMGYILGKRITESKKLLVGTELSISNIAEAVGFSSGSYFSQRFRLVTGMTPMEFRNNSHGGL